MIQKIVTFLLILTFNIQLLEGQELGHEDYNNVIKFCTSVLNSDPLDLKCRKARAESYLKIGKYAQALTDYEKALRIDSTDASIFHGEGTALFYLKNYSSAIIGFKNSIARDTAFTDSYIGLANCYIELGQFTMAIDNFTKALQLNGSISLLYDRGLAFLFQKDYAAAIVDFSDYIAKNDQDNYLVYYNRSIAYYSLDSLDKAMKDISRAIEVNDTIPEVYMQLAWILTKLGKHKKACVNYRKFRELGGQKNVEFTNCDD